MKYLILMKTIKISPLIIGVFFLVGIVVVYRLSGQKPSTGFIYRPTDIVKPTAVPKNICMSNSQCGSGTYCLQVCDNSTNGTCSPGKCVPVPANAS